MYGTSVQVANWCNDLDLTWEQFCLVNACAVEKIVPVGGIIKARQRKLSGDVSRAPHIAHNDHLNNVSFDEYFVCGTPITWRVGFPQQSGR